MAIPSYFKRLFREYVTGVGSSEVADQSPVQSVNSETGDVTINVPVDSVNGETGTVTLSASDVNALADTYSAPVQSVNSETGDVTINAPVESVNGKTGAVTIPTADFNTTSSISPSFNTWRQASADRPAYVNITVTALTDGSSTGLIAFEVDESGGTSPDYSIFIGYADRDLGSNIRVRDSQLFYIPPGAQYRINNSIDPTGNNSIGTARRLII
jgi:hypothetical protein